MTSNKGVRVVGKKVACNSLKWPMGASRVRPPIIYSNIMGEEEGRSANNRTSTDDSKLPLQWARDESKTV